MQARFVIPVDPLESFPFDLADRFPWTEKLDDLGLEQADDAFGKGVIVAVTDATHRRINPSLGQPFGVSDRQVLATPIAVMDGLVRLGREL